jgi:hypothetical protein
MGLGRAYQGKSGKHYTFTLTDTNKPELLPPKGGLILITGTDTDKPVFIGAAENLSGAFKNFDKWSKLHRLPDDRRILLLHMHDGRRAVLEDLLAQYPDVINDRF